MNDSRSLDLILLFLRLGFGMMMFLQHGLPKLERLFWGDPSQFADPFGVGAVATLIVAVAIEVVCSLLLVLGLLTRTSAVSLILLMLVIVFAVNGAALGDKELGLLYFFAFVAILIGGPGYYSLDRILKKSF